MSTSSGKSSPTDDHHALADVEVEVAILFRRADTSRSVVVPTGPLERSAYQILLVLDRQGALNINALAQVLGLDASTITRQVVAMERADLVERHRDDEDRRSVVVRMTAHGGQELADHRSARAELYGRVLAEWDDEDRAALAAMLHRLNASLDGYRRAGSRG